MRKLVLLAILLLSGVAAISQNLLFTSEFGGANSNGALVKYNPLTTNSSVFSSLGGNPFTATNEVINGDNLWQFQKGGLTLGMDGKYYGVSFLPSGIVNLDMEHKTDRGIFYRFDPVTNKTQVLYSFTGAGEYNMANINHTAAYNENLAAPTFRVVEMSSGVFYGIAVLGGSNDVGGAWKFDVNTMTYRKIGEFSNQVNGIGYDPLSNLVHGDGNNLYGVLSKRNVNIPARLDLGVLYRINTVTDQLEFVGELDPAGTSLILNFPTGDIVYNSVSNKIFGTKLSSFPNNSGHVGGGVWSYNLGTNTASFEWNINFYETSTLGSQLGGLAQGNDGKIYVFSKDGGAYNFGTIIKYDPGLNTHAKVVDIPGPLFTHNSGFQVVGTKIYGSWEDDYNHPYFQMFSYDVMTGILDNYIPFANSLPGYNKEIQFFINNNKIIGRMTNGGTANAGSIFSYDIGTQASTVLAENNSLQGRGIVGELTQLNDSILLGYTGMGGSLPNQPGFSADKQHELGDLVQINARTGVVTVLPDAFKHTYFPASYNTDQICLKFNRPLLASNGKLYYSYIHLGYAGNTFRISSYTLGSNTRADITVQNITLANDYESVGLTEVATGKVLSCFRDSIYVWDINTNAFTTRKFSHNENTYGFYKGNFLKASNGKIYGTTKVKGYDVNPPVPVGNAVIFSLDPVNYNFTAEYTFPAGIKNCNAGLKEYNGKLYGSTNYGGTNNNGYLFSYTIATSTFAVLYNFNKDTDGAGFEGEWTVLNNKLYATSYTGGPSGFGTLVEFNPATNALTVLKNLSMNDGRSFRGTPLVFNDVYSVNAPITTAGTGAGCSAGTFTIPVTVNNFNMVKGFTLRLDFDPTLMAYTGFANINPGLTGCTVTATNISANVTKIVIAWPGTTAVSLANSSKLADLKFTLISGTPALAFNNTAGGGAECQYLNSNGDVMNDLPSSTYYINYTGSGTLLPGTPGAISGAASVCQGQNTVPYTVPSITNATGYSWSYTGTGATINGTTNSVTVSFAANATSGNLKVQGTNNCGNGPFSANFPVTVNSLPGAAGAITGSSAVCQGQSAVIYSVMPVAGALSYVWSYSGTGVTINPAGPNAVSINFAANASSGNLTAYATNSCGNGAVSPAFPVNVNTPPVANAGVNQYIPNGTSTILNGSVTSGTGPFAYHWEPAVYLVNSNVQNPTTVVLTTSTNFTLTVTDAIGCTGNDDVFVNVSGPLTLTATANPDTICNGQAVQLNAFAGGGTASYTYAWTSVPAGFTATIPNPIAYPTVNTLYTVTVNDGSSTISGNVAVTVQTVPLIPAMPSGPDTVNLSVVTYTDYTIAPVSGASSYSWLLLPTSAGVISGYGTTGTVTWNPAFLGLAQIRVVALNTCGESNYSAIKYTFADNVTGIAEPGMSSAVIYPNPNDGSFYIRSEKKIDKVIIRDMIGRTIDEVNSPADGYRFNYTQSNGTYFVQIFGKDSNIIRKIVIQNGK
ncbi:MAG: choice-of-anchor tandem repeat GloVer-containing protein [Bacteroidota bacterium]